MIRHVDIDDTTMRALERHETRAHAIPSREVRDLGHAVVLHDPRDADPFWNRMASVRWPDDEEGFDGRLAEALALFAVLGRRPHVWPSPAHSRPVDLAARLERHGFGAFGAGHVMVLEDPAGSPPVRATEPGRGVTLHAIRTPADAGATDCDELGLVLAESFGAPPVARSSWPRTCGSPWTTPGSCWCWCGWTASPPRAPRRRRSTGTATSRRSGRGAPSGGVGWPAWRPGMRWRSPGPREKGRAYLGVFSDNEPALRLYTRLGFASVGESPDMLLG